MARRALLSCVLSLVVGGAVAEARSFEGSWIGGFRGSGEWVFLQLRIGGEGKNITGRADLPLAGERDILLQQVAADDRTITFELPGFSGNLRFRGKAKGDDRITGSVAQNQAYGTFELHRLRTPADDELDRLSGDYVGRRSGTGVDDVILVYRANDGLFYVDYATDRIGRLYPLSDGRFVSGPSLLAGYPVELTARFERDGAGRVKGLTWDRHGEPVRKVTPRVIYRQEAVSIPSQDDVVLSGTLLLPAGSGPHPAVVIVPGTGPVTAASLLPFADGFARQGIAVLVHDKRGVGASTGNYARAGIIEMADDALAGLAWLKHHPAIDSRQMGLLGISLGGWAAPLAATRSADIRFLIIEAAPAVTPAEHERLRVENQMRADGHGPGTIVRALDYMDRKFDVGRTGAGWDELKRLETQGGREGWLNYVTPPVSLESLEWNWRHVLSFDPQPVLKEVRVPVLALYGELDRTVDSQFNKTLLERALGEAGNTDVTVRILPGANHHFFAALTGGPAEIQALKAFVGGYFEARVDWLRDRVELAAPVLANEALTSTLPVLAPGS